MKRRFILFLLLSMLRIIPAEAEFFEERNSHVICGDSAGMVLHNDNLYYTNARNTLIRATRIGGNALSVAPGETAFIYIPAGDTLTVVGGPGKGIFPGGAAIRVPKTSVLYVMGGGKLIAKGGAAGRGSKGLDGTEGTIQTFSYWGGNGGAGGNGGGGAGAGIGGNGGRGGYGGAGVYCPKIATDEDDDGCDGTAGNVGGNSESGEDCGMVYFVGTLDVNAYSGDTTAVYNFSATGYPSKKKRGGLFSNDWAVGGGGAGGNGNNGLLASKIGGGGAGAAGAGSGSSGGCTNFYRCDGSKLLTTLLKKLTQAAVDAIYAAISKNPTAAAAVIINIPGTDFKIKMTPGEIASHFVDPLLKLDFTPVQINGGGGIGSKIDLAPAPRISGVGFYCGDFNVSTITGRSFSIKPNRGAEAGKFGTTGSLAGAMRTSQVRINQDMERMTKENTPKKLIDAISFRMYLDNYNVDVKKPHDGYYIVVYSDNLPRVTVPQSKTPGAIFQGYCDSSGRYWYDSEGKPIPNAKDPETNRDIAIYLHPTNVTLYPRWSTCYSLVVRHFQERASHVNSQNPHGGFDENNYAIADYDFYFVESNAGETKARKTVGCRNFNAFDLHGSQSTQTIEMTDPTKIYVADFYYDCRHYSLNWSLPIGTQVFDTEYTQKKTVPFGQTIVPPKYAVNVNTGQYRFLTGWKEDGKEVKSIETMPAHETTYEAIMEPIPVAMSFKNDSQCGTVTPPLSKNLGQQILFNVTPKKGYEVDSCSATVYSPLGIREVPVLNTEQGELILGTLDMDSIAVEVHYKGTLHKLYYSESTSPFRMGSMTMFRDGGKGYNDEARDQKLNIRNKEEIWIRPERSFINSDYVCRQLVVTNMKGETIPVEYVESYDKTDKYNYFWHFAAPDEDVNVVATYGVLDQHQVKTVVTISNPEDCEFKAYSNRGRLLDNRYLFNTDTGYSLETGQLLWFEADSKSKIDTMIVEVDGKQQFTVTPNAFMFLHRDATDSDTTKAPKVICRYAIKLPVTATHQINISIVNGGHNDGMSAVQEIEALEAQDPRTDGRCYDTMGNCWGDDPQNLPPGLYVRNGKKFVKK